jgi:hypothetical protein
MGASAFIQNLLLRMLERSAEDRWVLDSVSVLGKRIEESINDINSAAAGGDEEFAEAVADEECERIERLLGSVFIMCQVHITDIVSTGIKCLRIRRPPKVKYEKEFLLRLGPAWRRGSKMTLVEILDAFANYFKHRDEWGARWRKLPGVARRTAYTIRKVGARPGSSGNLRLGAEVLGNPSYKDVKALAKIVRDWGKQLHAFLAAHLAP